MSFGWDILCGWPQIVLNFQHSILNKNKTPKNRRHNQNITRSKLISKVIHKVSCIEKIKILSSLRMFSVAIQRKPIRFHQDKAELGQTKGIFITQRRFP